MVDCNIFFFFHYLLSSFDDLFCCSAHQLFLSISGHYIMLKWLYPMMQFLVVGFHTFLRFQIACFVFCIFLNTVFKFKTKSSTHLDKGISWAIHFILQAWVRRMFKLFCSLTYHQITVVELFFLISIF